MVFSTQTWRRLPPAFCGVDATWVDVWGWSHKTHGDPDVEPSDAKSQFAKWKITI